MKIEIENGEVVCSTTSDWKRLPENEHKFLSDCYTYAIWTSFTASGKIKMRVQEKAKYAVELFRMMFVCAKAHEIEIAQEVVELWQEWKQKAAEELLLEERLAFLEGKRKAWERRQRDGCDGCQHCERIGESWFRCKYSGEDLTARFSEVWDPVTRCMIIFHEVGVPNAHCKDYYQERKEYGR